MKKNEKNNQTQICDGQSPHKFTVHHICGHFNTSQNSTTDLITKKTSQNLRRHFY